jgi:hypothetical protein
MPEQHLDDADVGSTFQQMSRETVPQDMDRDDLVDLGLACCRAARRL